MEQTTEIERTTTLGPRSIQTSKQDGQTYRKASVSRIKQIMALQVRIEMTEGDMPETIQEWHRDNKQRKSIHYFFIYYSLS